MNAVVNGKPGVIGATIGSRSQISAQTPPGHIAYTYYGVNGSPVGHEPGLNLIAGPYVSLTGVDNPGGNRVDITISAAAPPVASVFGRTGAVVAVSGDYSASQVTNAVDKTQVYADPAWISSLAWSKIAGAPATGVASVFGRAGTVVAQAGDYLASQVTNAADTTQSYANPAWITSLDWSKITNPPALGTGSVTSVGLSMPAEFAVAGSPITSAGTFAVTKASQAPNLIYASPVGTSGAPVFRALDVSDIPAGVGAVASVFGRTGAVVAATGDYAVAQITGAVATTRTITAGAGLTGGGDLSANRTLAVIPATASALGGVKIGANITVQADGTISVAAPGGGQTPWLQNVDANGFALSNCPTITGQTSLTLAANGANSLTLATNAKTRLTIDNAGNAILNANDASSIVRLYLGSGLTGAMFFTPSGGELDFSTQGGPIQLMTGGTPKARLSVDSAGHITVNPPDDTNAPFAFTNVLGPKLMLWSSGVGTGYGLGLQSGQFQIYCDPGTRISFGSGGSASFTEWVSINSAGLTFATFINSTANIAATGANQLAFNTNAKTRLTVRSDGTLMLYACDDGREIFYLGPDGLSYLLRDSVTAQLYCSNTAALSGGGAVNLICNGVNRLSIDSAGHINIGQPGDASAPLTFAGNVGAKINFFAGTPYGIGVQSFQLQVITDPSGRISLGAGSSAAFTEWASVRTGVLQVNGNAEVAVNASLSCNVYNSAGTTWNYRANGAGIQMVAYDSAHLGPGSSIAAVWVAPLGTAGASAPTRQALAWSVYTGTGSPTMVTLSGLPTAIFAQVSGTDQPNIASNVPYGYMWFQATSDTVIRLYYRGSDGAVRGINLTVS